MSKLATRLEGINEYYFSAKLREIEAMNLAGKQVINLGIGSPDLPPHPEVIAELNAQSGKPDTHAYQSYKGSLVFRQAIADWYQRSYQVVINPNTEVLPMMGSKEGIMHICMTYFQEGDTVLIPDPGYPTYAAAVKIAGAETLPYALCAENDHQPDFEAINKLISTYKTGAVKAMFINYPHMPTGRKGSMELFTKIIAFARKHQLLVIHDNPYSFILNDEPLSIMAVPNAMEVALELNSLSKSHNMAGWRVGMLVGAKQRLEDILKFKSNMDSGMFLPVQLAAAKALQLPGEWYESVSAAYHERRKLVYQLLDLLDCDYSRNQAGMFVWAKVPPVHADGYALSDAVLAGANVFITPGCIFGQEGKSYIRISLCSPLPKIAEAINRIKSIKSSANV